jgi:hypothetical protein
MSQTILLDRTGLEAILLAYYIKRKCAADRAGLKPRAIEQIPVNGAERRDLVPEGPVYRASLRSPTRKWSGGSANLTGLCNRPTVSVHGGAGITIT